MLFGGGLAFSNFLADFVAAFMFILWLWVLMVVARDLFRRHIVGNSVAEELEKLDRLKSNGANSEQEYGCLQARIVQ